MFKSLFAGLALLLPADFTGLRLAVPINQATGAILARTW